MASKKRDLTCTKVTILPLMLKITKRVNCCVKKVKSENPQVREIEPLFLLLQWRTQLQRFRSAPSFTRAIYSVYIRSSQVSISHGVNAYVDSHLHVGKSSFIFWKVLCHTCIQIYTCKYCHRSVYPLRLRMRLTLPIFAFVLRHAEVSFFPWRDLGAHRWCCLSHFSPWRQPRLYFKLLLLQMLQMLTITRPPTDFVHGVRLIPKPKTTSALGPSGKRLTRFQRIFHQTQINFHQIQGTF